MEEDLKKDVDDCLCRCEGSITPDCQAERFRLRARLFSYLDYQDQRYYFCRSSATDCAKQAQEPRSAFGLQWCMKKEQVCTERSVEATDFAKLSLDKLKH